MSALSNSIPFLRAVVVSLLASGQVIAVSAPASAQVANELTTEWVTVPNGRVRLLAGGQAPGTADARLAAIEVQLAPGWKTYWRNPGESGIPPSFDWSKSQNTEPKSVEVLYPAPKRIADPGGELIGYTSGVVFPVRLSPTSPAAPIKVAVEVSLGICREVCIPIETTLALDVPQPAPKTAPPALITRALESAPRPADQRRALDPEVVSIAGSVTDTKGKLIITARRASEIFLEGPDGIFVPLPTKPAAQGGSTEPVRFEVDLSKAPDIKDALGKPIRMTLVGAGGASEFTWIAK